MKYLGCPILFVTNSRDVVRRDVGPDPDEVLDLVAPLVMIFHSSGGCFHAERGCFTTLLEQIL